jgi:hypothetical protein
MEANMEANMEAIGLESMGLIRPFFIVWIAVPVKLLPEPLQSFCNGKIFLDGEKSSILLRKSQDRTFLTIPTFFG